MATKPSTVEEYLATLGPPAREAVEQLRALVHATVPGLEERISYGIPTFTLAGTSVVHVAGWARHVSLYPVPDVDHDLAERIARYRGGKGTLRLPLTEPVPDDVVRAVVTRLAEERGWRRPG